MGLVNSQGDGRSGNAPLKIGIFKLLETSVCASHTNRHTTSSENKKIDINCYSNVNTK